MLKLKTKERNKANTKDVGGVLWTTNSSKTYSNPNSKMQTLTSDSKGITLIALIITIIVMLILVAVTVNVALNGGLFSKAQTAVEQTERETILEQIIDLAEWENDGKINVKKTVENIKYKFEDKNVSTDPENLEGTEQTDVTIEIQGKGGKYKYKIGQTKITILGNSSTNPNDDPETIGGDITDIRLGDKWTNVTFKDLPKVMPDGYNNQQIIIAEENDGGYWLIELEDGVISFGYTSYDLVRWVSWWIGYGMFLLF